MTLISFGKRRGKDSRWVLLRDPSYVAWARGERPTSGPLASLVASFQRHAAAFDRAPLTERCFGSTKGAKCASTANYATVYVGSSGGLGANVFWWCETCDPNQEGAASGRLRNAKTYDDLLKLLAMHGATKADYESFIAEMAKAKGFPKRLTTEVLDRLLGA